MDSFGVSPGRPGKNGSKFDMPYQKVTRKAKAAFLDTAMLFHYDWFAMAGGRQGGCFLTGAHAPSKGNDHPQSEWRGLARLGRVFPSLWAGEDHSASVL